MGKRLKSKTSLEMDVFKINDDDDDDERKI